MDDLFRKKAAIWNERLRNLIDTKDYRQKEFAQEFNKRYQTKCTQKDVSRWVNVGTTQGNGTIGFPSYQNMLYIADFFEVSVAYLTGETDFTNFDFEKASTFIGLNEKSIRTLRQMANFNAPHSKTWRIHMNSNQIIDNFITSEYFFYLMQSLAELDTVYSGPNKEKLAWDTIYQKYDKDLITEALKKRDDHFEEGSPIPSSELCEAIRAVNEAIDIGYEESQKQEYENDVYRYRLERTFSQLIDNLYPSQ